jgi:3-oxoacyl-[acyl-carrier-protein] synthase-1
MSHEVHIVALAATTPLGLAAESSAAAVRAGLSRIVENPRFVDATGDILCCGTVPTLAPQLAGADRLSELLRGTWAELEAKLRMTRALSARLSCHLALPEARPGFDAASARRVTEAFTDIVAGEPSSRADVVLAGRGHAGGFDALRACMEQLTRGTVEIGVVAGVESYLESQTLDWLDSDLRLAREGVRGGFPPGEAASMLALASDAYRRRTGLQSLGLIRAVACGTERRRETDPGGLLGEALAGVLEQVGAHLRLPDERVDDVYCDLNDERARTTDHAFAVVRMGHLFRDCSRYTSSVGLIGDVGAASAPLNCVLASRAWSRRYALGPLALVSGSSWAGLRGAALLEEPKG